TDRGGWEGRAARAPVLLSELRARGGRGRPRPRGRESGRTVGLSASPRGRSGGTRGRALRVSGGEARDPAVERRAVGALAETEGGGALARAVARTVRLPAQE